jgi:hypothetical protein
MNKPLLLPVFIASSLLLSTGIAEGQASTPRLWYWQQAYPESASDVASIESQIDLAYSYGYTGVAFWSSAFSFMGSPVHPANNVAYMQQIISYARSKGMGTLATVAPYGYSDDYLINNANWAEGEHITGSRFIVNGSRNQLIPVNSYPGLANPGFEQGETAWFSWADSNMGIDTTVAHSGTASGVINNASGDSRFTQALAVTPWRQYHVRAFYKTQNFQGHSQIEVVDLTSNAMLYNQPLATQPTGDWTEIDFTFNSRASTQPTLLFGVWNGCQGKMWWDDIYMEETSLVYVLRRSGTPLKLYDPSNLNTSYQEGVDFNTITDSNILSGAGFSDQYHTPAVVTLPSTTNLSAGQTVAIDYYAVQPVQPDGSDVGMCLTEAAAQSFLQQNAQAVVGNTPAGTNYLLSYDEMRHMNSCASCKAKNMTPGQLLAWHVQNTAGLFQSLAPSAALYVWGDMFDPYQNAVDNYYFVEGSIAGSWATLPSNVTIMNWNLANLKNSLTWFSGLNPQQTTAYHQIIAGYYDSGNGAGSATQELQQATGIPGITGLMYTTWLTDYSQLQAFALAAKTGWAAYLASISDNVTQQITVSASVVTLSRATGRYSQTIKLTNNGSALSGAAYVADSLPSGVTMYQPDGYTSAQLPAGSPYKEIGAIGSGASVTLTIQFSRTGTQAITYTPRIVGPGSR